MNLAAKVPITLVLTTNYQQLFTFRCNSLNLNFIYLPCILIIFVIARPVASLSGGGKSGQHSASCFLTGRVLKTDTESATENNISGNGGMVKT
jgi:hypothetical protein